MYDKKRILYIGNKLVEHGRTPTNIDTLGVLLEEQGHTLYYSSNKLSKWKRLKDMLRTIKEHQHDVDVVLIDTYSTVAFYFAWLCGRRCKKLGLKYITVLNGGNLPDRIKNSAKWSKQLFSNSYTNVAVSGYLYKAMLEHEFESTIIENSININEYPFRHRTNLAPSLLWVRAFHRTYNPRMAIQVVAKLKKSYPNIKLTMVGPDVDGSMKKCEALAEELEVTENVNYTGKLSKEDWKKLSTEFDVFINTTNFDNLPVSVIEAMALGLPVVSTNVGGVPYLIKHEETGLLVNIADADEMCNSIERLLQSGELASALSKNGRKAAEGFDWNIIRDKWNKLLSEV